jgi:hypothetical protein
MDRLIAGIPAWKLMSAVIALGLFAQKLLHDWPQGLAANSLWMCHVGNLALGIGLLIRKPLVTRIAVMWIYCGLPMWLIDIVVTGTSSLPSVLSHVGGVVVAGVVLSCKCWMSQRFDWLVAWVGFLVVQQISRSFTLPELNINLAHSVHESSRTIFASYSLYAVFIAASSAFALWAVHHAIVYFKR